MDSTPTFELIPQFYSFTRAACTVNAEYDFERAVSFFAAHHRVAAVPYCFAEIFELSFE